MSGTFRKLLQGTLPPVLFDALLQLRGRRYGFHGDYRSYDEAVRHCHTPSAYHSQRIIDTALRNALEGSDRPGVVMTTREQQLLAASLTPLMACALKREIRVLDFGGGLGADFRRLRAAMPTGWCIAWDVLETMPMAEAGRQHVRETGLHFFSDWNQLQERYDLVHASSSVQYTPDPVHTFERLTILAGHYMVVTRCPLIPGSRDRLTVQRVPPSYYDASYPAWFLGEDKWLPLIERNFIIRRRWSVPEDRLFLDGHRVMNQGFLLERR